MQRPFLRAAILGGALLIAIFIFAPIQFRSPGMDAHADGGGHPTSSHAAAPAAERKIKFYRNPMGHPDTSPVPKKDSMGMDYIPVYDGEDRDDGSVKVSPGKIQRTGVETTIAARKPLTRTIKAPGVVQLDERRISVIAPRFDGYVESVGERQRERISNRASPWSRSTGRRSQPGCTPRRRATPADGAARGCNLYCRLAPAGVIGAKRRLLNLGVPADYIEAIIRDKRVPDTLTFRATGDAVVIERNVVEGQAFKAGDVLFRLADHPRSG